MAVKVAKYFAEVRTWFWSSLKQVRSISLALRPVFSSEQTVLRDSDSSEAPRKGLAPWHLAIMSAGPYKWPKMSWYLAEVFPYLQGLLHPITGSEADLHFLTIIFFKWVGSTTNKTLKFQQCDLETFTSKHRNWEDFWSTKIPTGSMGLVYLPTFGWFLW